MTDDKATDNPLDGLGDLFAKLGREVKAHKAKFTSMYDVEFPLEISGVEGKIGRPDATNPMTGIKAGELVKIRPCAKSLEGQTFLGMYIGELPSELAHEVEKETSKLHIRVLGNCAFYVFALHRIIFGCESWWEKIENPADIEDAISDQDIQDVWYVKALQGMIKLEADKETEDACKKES